MIPQKRLSTSLVYGDYLYPDNIVVTSLYDYSIGGIALQDASQGLQVQAWMVWIDDVKESVWISSPTHPASILFTLSNLTEVSLAFDQNMRPFIAFVQFGNARFWWYDSLSASQIFSDLPSGSVSPRCTLDDTRPLEVAASDIILTYINNNNLFFRAERDRYTIEYVLQTNLSTLVAAPTINKVGMNNRERLQFTLYSGGYQ